MYNICICTCVYTCTYAHTCMVTPPYDTQTPSKHRKNQCETCFYAGRILIHFWMQHSYRIETEGKGRIPESKIPKMRNSKNQNIQESIHPGKQNQILCGILGCFCFLIFGVWLGCFVFVVWVLCLIVVFSFWHTFLVSNVPLRAPKNESDSRCT